MSNPIKSASMELHTVILDALGRLVADGKVEACPLPAFNIEIPADKSHGDFATNVAMACAKTFKSAPRKIAELICDSVILDGTSFDRCEIAGPGFINFFLSKKWFSNVITAVLNEKENYGRTDTGAGKKVLVEFVSANPTGPMHIGNARGGAIGDCLAAVLDWAGYNVCREFYINDTGNQIEKFATSLEVRYLQLYKDGIDLPEDAYQGEDIVVHAKNFAEINGDKYVEADSAQRREALVAFALPKNIQKLEDDLLKYRIVYDKWFRESTLHESGAVNEIIELLKKSGYTYELEGALWFKSSEFGDEKDRVLVRANGIPTYFVPDIAYHYNKIVTRGFDKAIDIFGADHHGYIARMKAALSALGVDPAKLDIVIMQMVRLVKDGETYKLSKRSGRAVTLETLLDDVPIDAARFFFNLREANSHFEFDLDLAVDQSSKNPVFYVQYAHARICSILRNLESEGITVQTLAADKFAVLDKPEEIELIRYIAALPNTVDASAKEYDPAKITKYSLELASLFHKFYGVCRIKGEETNVMQARLNLCLGVKTVLKNSLSILKIDCPEKM